MSLELLNAMKVAALYDHATAQFTLIETHISWVLLTGSFAYKIKKPAAFGFLDFSSLAQRKKFCDLEVTLNRRLAPYLYEGVVPISGSPAAPRLNDNSDPFEYSVKMKQFSQNDLFDTLSQDQQLTAQHMQAVARQLAEFHGRVECCPQHSDYGSAQQIRCQVQQNFDPIRSLLVEAEALAPLQAIERWAWQAWKNAQPIMVERKQQGFIRACHGDLHLGNIALWTQNVALFDCIEFNESLRWIDTMADLGFLLMDLEARQLHGLAATVLDTYLEYSGDYCGLALLRFYKSYRAMVRARVALLRRSQEALEPSAGDALYCQYQRYVDLAAGYCREPAPFLIMMHGLSGSGKSTVSEYIVQHHQAIRLRSDVERKRLFGLRADESSAQAGQDIYSLAVNEKTYQRLTRLTRYLLSHACAVVVDSAALKEEERQLFCAIAGQLSVPFLVIDCQAPEAELRQRIRQRQHNSHEASEATVDILRQQQAWLEPLTAREQPYTLTLDTTDSGWPSRLEDGLLALSGKLPT